MQIESTTITEGDRKEKEKEKNPKESTVQFIAQSCPTLATP